MSEQINNREYRKKAIKSILKKLHQGVDFEQVKAEFQQAFDGVSAAEIAQAEQALISEGLPSSQVQSLCDVHAAVFKGSIDEIHQDYDSNLPGHPADLFKLENRHLEQIIEKDIKPNLAKLDEENTADSLKEAFDELLEIDVHYLKKENLYFPYMERYGISAPPKVMWGVDDEIREQIEKTIDLLEQENFDKFILKNTAENVILKITEMIYKEEKIMLPMIFERLTLDEWKHIAMESEDIGYIFSDVPIFDPTIENEEALNDDQPGNITLPSGSFKLNELIWMLNALPFDITFVDKDGNVKYFSQGKDRIFIRTKAVIGRKVENCHPPASAHIVQKIVEDFISGNKDREEFWIKMKDIYAYIRYFAVRNDSGEYLGVVEVSQNIKPIQDINGEKRLLSD